MLPGWERAVRTAHAEGGDPRGHGLVVRAARGAVSTALGDGTLPGAELLAETHRLVARAETAAPRATCRWDREHRPDDSCSVCGSEKVVTHTAAGVTYRCGHHEVAP